MRQSPVKWRRLNGAAIYASPVCVVCACDVCMEAVYRKITTAQWLAAGNQRDLSGPLIVVCKGNPRLVRKTDRHYLAVEIWWLLCLSALMVYSTMVFFLSSAKPVRFFKLGAVDGQAMTVSCVDSRQARTRGEKSQFF